MSRYIDADKIPFVVGQTPPSELDYVRRYVIDNMPTADVVEVKHGRWVDGKRMSFDGTFHWFRQCSECLYEREDDTPEKDTNYCPNCGSLMDLGEENE